MKFDFPDEDLIAILHIDKEEPMKVKNWKMYFDGASNTLRHGIGAILISPNEDHCPFTAKLNFDYTNNVAEYKACVMGLQAAI